MTRQWGRLVAALMLVSASWPVPAASQDADYPVVRSLSFEGNESIPDRAFRTSIATSQAPFIYRFVLTHWLGFGSAPRFDDTEFRRDLLRIKAMYGVRGFPDAQVDTTIRRNGRDLSITVHITENQPMTVDTLQVENVEGILTREEIDRQLALRQGEPFDRIAFQESADRLKHMLKNEGYAFADVTGGFRASPDGRSVSVELVAEPGPRATVERVIVEGTSNIDPQIVLDAIPIRPGDVFSANVLERSEMDLFQMDLFRQVSVRLQDTVPETPGDSLVTVRIIARVAESPLQRARLSAGYGTLSCFRTMGALDLFNFTGGGRRLELRGSTSLLGVGAPLNAGFENGVCPFLANEDTSRLKLNYNTSITLHEPLLFSRFTTATASIYAERQTEIMAYLREAVGGEVSVTRQVRPGVPVRLSYSASWGRTVADPATFCAFLNVCRLEDTEFFGGRLFQSTVALTVVRDRTNSALDPSTGTAVSAAARLAPAVLGTDSLMRFGRISAEFESHHPVSRASVFSWRVEVGTLFSSRLSLSGGDAAYTPPEERFYSGGANTIRGFGQNLLGPVVRVLDTVRLREGQRPDSVIRTSPTGGSFLVLGTAEGRFPLPLFQGKLTGALFVDVGQVFERRAFQLDQLRVTPGVGIRYASLLGPIRLDVAFNPYRPRVSPLYRRVGGSLELADPDYQPDISFWKQFHLHFSIGQPF